MPRRRRRKLDRSVTCRVTLRVGGRVVKTVRRRLSVAQAVRELGRDPVGMEGRLMSGQAINVIRSLTPAVKVVLTYHADHRPDDSHVSRAHVGDLSAAVAVVRAGVPL